MRSNTLVRCGFLFLLAAVITAAGAATAGASPAVPAAVEACLGVGTALVVAGDGPPLVEIFPAHPAGAEPPTVTLSRPARIGACAEVQAFWRDGAQAAVRAELVLLAVRPDGTTDFADGAAFEHERQGTAHRGAELKAMVAPDGAGSYDFVALLRVTAEAGGGEVADSLRLPFRVRVPASLAAGAISGVVHGADGLPLGGASVQAVESLLPYAVDGSAAPMLSEHELPILQHRASTQTDADGHYWLEVPDGVYAVTAAAADHTRQWYEGRSDEASADLLDVVSGAVIPGVDFHLPVAPTPAPTDPPADPTPAPPADYDTRVIGRVTDPAGEPLAGAEVTSFSYARTAAGQWQGCEVSVPTEIDGTYELPVCGQAYGPTFLVGARMVGRQWAWYAGSVSTPYDAQPLAKTGSELAAPIDLVLQPAPDSGVTGVIRHAGGHAIPRAPARAR
jgi:hypothetical protein